MLVYPAAPRISRRADLNRRLAILGPIVAVGAAFVGGVLTTERSSARTPEPSPAGQLSVVELFTSQGCSSCPPANANLVRLEQNRS